MHATQEPHWIAYVTLVVSMAAVGLTATFSYLQWQLARTKLKWDLFDRRWAVYVAAKEFLSTKSASKAEDMDLVARFAFQLPKAQSGYSIGGSRPFSKSPIPLMTSMRRSP